MPGRLPVERWSRPELEDRFHSIADQVQSLKQNNHRLQREMKILNGRIGTGRGAEVRDGPERDEIDELHRSNQVLSQKLKVLKHQLLNYTATNRPRPSTSATRPSTAQPKQMLAGTAGQSQRKPLPSTVGRRPQSAVVGSSRKIGQRTRAIPASAGANVENQSSSRTEPIPVNPVAEESPERTKLESAQIRSRSGSQNNGWVENVSEKPIQRQFSQENGDFNAGDGRLRDLQRQNRKILTENDELRFSLEKSEQKLDTLRREYDRITVELEQTRQELHTQSDSLSSFREEAQRKTENSSKSAEISDRELAILREECRALKAAHDRLIAKSMEEQNSGKATLEEMARLRVQLEQSSSESQSERQELESLVQRLRSENARLERELRLIEQGRRNREPMEDIESRDRGNDRIQENDRNVRADNQIGHKPINGKIIQNPHGRLMQQSEAQIPPNSNNEEAVLNKLFTDVMDIVNNHVVGNNPQSVDGNGNKADFAENRWHRMYEDVYEELEKVRRLLLSEHDLNGKLKEQMRQMALENENLKAKYEQNLVDLRKELEERGLKMGILERELESVAAAGEMKDLMLGGRKFTAGGKQPGIESTELSLQISKLSMSQLALEQAESEKPTVFIAVEFFDFELQTSQLVIGPEADFDFTAIFELTVSDLFIHYLQTEGINVELYIVKDGLNYELWSQAKIPLRKLLTAQTPTQFRGELIFSAISNDAEKEQKTPPVLARLAYTVQVPFSLLRALAAQRRRMAATALIPLGPENVDEDTNELIIQIHRCVGLDRLKSVQDQNGPSLPTTYVDYEFFHFPVHMSKVVAQSGNPMFEDSQTWRLPAGSEAIHKYLLEEDLLIFVIGENSNATENKEAGSLQSRALGHISLPLFPLSQNQKIRGSFPLVDRADESIVSGASIDVSIYWKLAYVFEGMNGEEKVRVKRFQPLSNVEAKKTVEDTVEVRNDDTVASNRISEANNQQMQSVQNASFSENEAVNSAESSEEEEEMSEQELRRRLFQNTVAMKEQSMNGNAENSKSEKEVPKENGDKPVRMAPNDAVKHKEVEAANSISAPEKIESPKSSSGSEDHAQINEVEDDDAESVKSDATYTLEGVPDFEEDEDEAKDEKAAEKEVVIEDEDIQAQTVENEEKNEEKPVVKPEPAVRRSLLGELPPIQPQRPIPQVETESSFESVREASSSKEQQAKKSVEFTDPLHSSIPPSDISSSFAEDALSGESARSSRSNASESSSSSNSRGESSTPTNEEGTKKKEQNEPGKAAFLPRRKQRTRKGRQRKQPDMTAMPTTSAIRIRPKEESVESSLSEHSLASPRDGKSIVMIKVGKLRVLEHSPLLHPEYDSGRVFVEWNFLDIERELCETEGTMQLPRHADEQVDFDQQRGALVLYSLKRDLAYELNQKRVALLKQWTELNIRLTFTLVLEADEQQGQEPGESDDLCMGELDLMEVLNTNNHTLIMRNVDNMAIAILEVEVDYSARLMQQIREAIDEAGDDEMIDEV